MSKDNTVTLLRALTLGQLIILGLAYMQPIVVLDTFGIVSLITSGHVAGAYVLSTLILIFTALSYGKLSKRFPSSGSAYTYVQKSISPYLGFLVGWSSLIDYLFMPMVNMIQAKSYLFAIFPNISPWIFVIILTFIVTFFNVIGIRFVANLNFWIVAFQLFILAVFVFMMIDFIWSNLPLRMDVLSVHPNWTHPKLGPSSFTISSFVSNKLELIPLLSGASILCFSFLGFDSISNFSEEANDPKKTIPKAILLTVLYAGLLFVLVSYLTQLIFPVDFPYTAPNNSSQPDIILLVAGKFFQAIMLGLATFSVFAGGLVAQTGVSRLMFVMGRDEIFPKSFFGYIHHKFRTPSKNIILVGTITLLACYLNLETIISVISFGALMAFIFVNVAVIVQFYIKEKKRKGLHNKLVFLIFPVIGAISNVALWVNLNWTALIFGLLWILVGVLYLFILKYIFNKDLSPFEEKDEISDVVEETVEILDEALYQAHGEIFNIEQSLEEKFGVDEVKEELIKTKYDLVEKTQELKKEIRKNEETIKKLNKAEKDLIKIKKSNYKK